MHSPEVTTNAKYNISGWWIGLNIKIDVIFKTSVMDNSNLICFADSLFNNPPNIVFSASASVVKLLLI